jgi:outer membrane protein assembly factor BamB
MTTLPRQLTILVACALALTSTARAANWPQFRGPSATGIAPADAKPPTVWSGTKNMTWKTGLPGPGSSSPIIWGDRVFVTCYSGYGDGSGKSSLDKLERHLVCLDRDDGKILWDKSVPADLPEDRYSGFITEHGYASNTPVTDGQTVYVFFGKTGVLAFDFKGNQLWKSGVGKDSSNRKWGSAASLLLYKDKIIVNAAEESRSVRALNAKTGEEVWRAESERLELCYATPVLVDCGGGRLDLVLAMPGEIWGLNPDTGKLRWFAEIGINGNISPCVTVDSGLLIATGGFPEQATVAVRAGGKGDVTKTHVAWTKSTASYVPTPLALGGLLYFVTDRGAIDCLETKTGIPVFQEHLPNFTRSGRGGKPIYASPILAGGHIYAVTRNQGAFVLKPARYFQVIAQNILEFDTSGFNATPAVSGKQLFLRSNQAIYCLEQAPQ